ncbi:MULTISPECIES: tryptophan synthase subunit alpha [unclassified Curtobacterium]|uniref:tryptophan synthase subunit alpha n=1 Tax=unclassified Curtobacterium TaxID=257496 RepID=UPI000D95B747|nr:MULTISPECIES: tryptophan synthase subunit alpha [unclassified Curtobacterium]PYY33453.1 tryptophan synthase subunit alpha [Curtobacterium sp. MCBD17_030]PZE35111.1 tryptophan synthase subunit alpha [Curtobacterium sp. MCPF17_031]PZE57333.1 tryptophan synthase subunit alpha [Curtobacterium sp. MCPF17_001]PZF09390.1 tryptophan synthase subunit alpha [Curtobacterium sp. MCPF17_011]PZF63651.1 tryptophan synthase subunit alpha [Curtobacterium sp. MCPF17_047]
MAESRRTGRSLEVLRAEAAEEISVIVEHRCRQGDDPWDFMHTLPSVDEQVVLILRAEAMELDVRIGQRSAQWSSHPASGHGTEHGEEYHRLRRIALQHPELTEAVWKLMDALPGGR